MSSDDLYCLYQLHQIDAAILQIRRNAENLDPGREAHAKFQACSKKLTELSDQLHALNGEIKDLELQQKDNSEKAEKINKSLYGGAVVNPKEVELLEQQMGGLKAKNLTIDDRLLQLMELTPPVEAEIEKYKKAQETYRKQAAEKMAEFEVEKKRLEAEFKALSAKRPGALQYVPDPMLKLYESIRSRHGGVGMAEIAGANKCGMCGTELPTRTVISVQEDRLVQCENCHRILFQVVAQN